MAKTVEEPWHYVYVHRYTDSKIPFYVGKGTVVLFHGGDRTRYSRAYSNARRSDKWFEIVRSSGFKVEILFETKDHELAKRKEGEFIKQYGRLDLGTGTLINRNDGVYGNFHPDQLALLSRLHKGKNVPSEVRKRISASQAGRRHRPESIEKMRAIHKYSRLPADAAKKASEKRRKPIVQLDKNGNYVAEFEYIIDAARLLSCDRGDITKCCKGKIKTAAGFRWMYKDDYNQYIATQTTTNGQ